MVGKLAAFGTALNARVTFGRSIGVPMLLVNTYPVSCHALPAASRVRAAAPGLAGVSVSANHPFTNRHTVNSPKRSMLPRTRSSRAS